MFAPKVAKARSKDAANSADQLTLRRLAAQGERTLAGNKRDDPFKQETAHGKWQVPGASWDFSKIPISPPDRRDPFQARSPLTVPGISWNFRRAQEFARERSSQHLGTRETSLGRKANCSCGGECPHCRGQAHLAMAEADLLKHRPAGTDDLTETDLTVPRAEGDAGVPKPMDAGTSGVTSAPSCCDQAFAKGLAGSDYGGVICCKNVKHSCVWPSNMSSALTNAKARSISIDCARVHEDTHHEDVDCTGADVERPAFKAGKNPKAEECIAYKAEVACFDAHLTDCGDDAECKTQIQARRGVKKGQADANCA
jgi:hypothetical protein